MENQEILDSGLASASASELSLNSAAKEYLQQISKWGKFLAIVGLVFSALVVLIGFAFGTIMTKLMSMSGTAALSPSPFSSSGIGMGVGIFYSVFGLIMAYPPLRLLQFSKHAKASLNENSGYELENAFKRLRSIFRFYGILTIIVLSFYALALLMVLLMGGLAAFK